MRTSSIALVVILLAPAVASAQVSIRPGQYEYTLDLNMAVPKEAATAVLDAAGFNKQQKRLECITADQARQAKEDVVKFLAQEMQLQDCKMSDVKISANKLTFTTTCVEDSVKMVGTNEVTFGVDSFTSVGTMKGDGGLSSSMKMSARRVGECK